MSACFPPLYLIRGVNHTDPGRSQFYCPEYEAQFRQIPALLKEGRELIQELGNSSLRVRNEHTRILAMHADYVEHLVNVYIPKALGEDAEAARQFADFCEYMDRSEPAYEKYFDLWMCKRLVDRFAMDTPDHLAVD